MTISLVPSSRHSRDWRTRPIMYACINYSLVVRVLLLPVELTSEFRNARDVKENEKGEFQQELCQDIH